MSALVCRRCAHPECVCHLPGIAHCNVLGCTTKRYQKYKMCRKHLKRWQVHRDVLRARETPEERAPRRFWSKVQMGAADECWIYQGALNQGGYGDFQIVRTHWLAHRFAYTIRVGPIPEGLTIDHLCNVRTCVNPAHMEPVTVGENLRRMHRRRRGEAA